MALSCSTQLAKNWLPTADGASFEIVGEKVPFKAVVALGCACVGSWESRNHVEQQ